MSINLPRRFSSRRQKIHLYYFPKKNPKLQFILENCYYYRGYDRKFIKLRFSELNEIFNVKKYHQKFPLWNFRNNFRQK